MDGQLFSDEQFEKYIDTKFEVKNKDRVVTFLNDKGGVLKMFSVVLEKMNSQTTSMDKQYEYIKRHIIKTYKYMKDKMQFIDQFKILHQLTYSFYQLEKLKQRSTVSRKMKVKDIVANIMSDEIERDKFKYMVRHHYNSFADQVSRDLYLLFAEIIFELNEYYSPVRRNPQDAVQDAHERTDLFRELLQQIGVIEK